jgi:hypothetical protein
MDKATKENSFFFIQLYLSIFNYVTKKNIFSGNPIPHTPTYCTILYERTIKAYNQTILSPIPNLSGQTSPS